jgi:hypothetical protein
MINHSLIPVRGARRRMAVAGVLAATALASSFGSSVTPSTASGQDEVRAAYKWPVKPFDRQHPVRGSFGDPRTLFKTAPTLRGVMSGRGSFSLHRGIDISAKNGSPVYPVMSGVVTYVNREWLRVDSGGGRSFEYWHLHATVRKGDDVEAYKSVLGHVMAPAMHIHLTELQDERAVNPLAPGHIGPYRDTTTPRVTSISLRSARGSRELLPNLVGGRMTVIAGAEDDPTIDAPGQWRGLPVAPAHLSWEVRTWTGKSVLRKQTAIDLRSRLPRDAKFWQVYARGTYQNMAVFGRHYSWGQRGMYLFKLATFDTRRLSNGAYDLVVTATDSRGNSGSAKRRFLVAR